MIDWIFKNLGIVIFLVIVISQLVRGVMRARQATAERETTPVDYDEQRRQRETQEKIRRQIAARRGGQAPATQAAPPPLAREAPPLVRPETTQLPEPFGGPLGRMLEELQKRAQPQPEAVPPPPLVSARTSNAELERQEQLAAQLKTLEDARADAKRRAANVVEGKRVIAESEPALRSAARGQLLADLSDRKSLRRAFVLREVLGAPVALR